jgi:hypothetical protein
VRRRRSKFGAVRTNGYASRFESRVADELRASLRPYETLAEQVPIKFACGAKYIADFAIADANGEIVRWVEAKGFVTPVWRLKLRLLRHEFPDIAARLTIVTPPKRGKKSK